MAAALRLLAPVHTRPLRLPAGTPLSRASRRLPDQGRGRRLSRALRRPVRAPGAHRRPRAARRARHDQPVQVETDAGTYRCRDVVVATGTYGSDPPIPDVARDLDPAIRHLHSGEYRRPADLPEGAVLVVGASHSGCDIAYELAATRQTTLAGPDRGQVPLRWGSWPLRLAWPPAMALGRHLLTRSNPLGRRLVAPLRGHGSPMLRVKRSDLAARGVVRITARVVGTREGLPLLADGRVLAVRTVIWATGFEQRFDWVDLPWIPARGWPPEVRGVVADVSGLYFCGLAFQHSLASGDLAGVGDDARYLAGRIRAERTRERTARDPASGGAPA
ncbi:MAG TPA: NAD(P)-binding domain-containing protein [Propionibacteriaceae bacterium]|nr:NAD(P)-binding domain-containing protein [Propionibacteriaceae bacterium]